MSKEEESRKNDHFWDNQLGFHLDEEGQGDLMEDFGKKSRNVVELKDYMNENSVELPNTKAPEFFACEVEDQWLLESILSGKPQNYEDSKIDIQIGPLSQPAYSDVEAKNQRDSIQAQDFKAQKSNVHGKKETKILNEKSAQPIFEQDEEEQRNETKNIPKNFGKEIIRFVKSNREFIEELLLKVGSSVSYDVINVELQSRKKKMNKIKNLRSLWTQLEFSSELRIISEHFFRKRCLQWIYNSRIEKRLPPLKYRLKLQQALKKPNEFRHLKSQ